MGCVRCAIFARELVFNVMGRFVRVSIWWSYLGTRSQGGDHECNMNAIVVAVVAVWYELVSGVGTSEYRRDTGKVVFWRARFAFLASEMRWRSAGWKRFPCSVRTENRNCGSGITSNGKREDWRRISVCGTVRGTSVPPVRLARHRQCQQWPARLFCQQPRCGVIILLV